MIGITLSSEQIRTAPPEVRRWIEHEIATSLGLQLRTAESQDHIGQLAICGQDELAAILALITGVLPAVNVFFELGRKGTGFAQDRLEAYRLSDIQSHTRLQNRGQVMWCLDLIDKSLHRIRGSADTSFYAIDGDYCFIATQNQENILHLWLDLIGRDEILGHEGIEAVAAEARAIEQPASPGDRGRPSPFDAPGPPPARG